MKKRAAICVSMLLLGASLGLATSYDYPPPPQSVQGSSGKGWYIPTGQSVYSPDGHLAWEFRDAYDTEPFWVIQDSLYQDSVPEFLPYRPEATNVSPQGANPVADEVLWKLIWKLTPDAVPSWPLDAPKPVVIGSQDPLTPEPQGTSTPEPSSFWLLGASSLLGAKLLRSRAKKD